MSVNTTVTDRYVERLIAHRDVLSAKRDRINSRYYEKLQKHLKQNRLRLTPEQSKMWETRNASIMEKATKERKSVDKELTVVDHTINVMWAVGTIADTFK